MHRVAVARLFDLRRAALARSCSWAARARSFSSARESWRERGEPRLEVVDLEIVLLHGEQRLDVGMHGADVSVDCRGG